jgi:cytoskeleton-associated protein 5
LQDGLESKNNRTRVESAEEIGCMIDRANTPTAKFQESIQAVAKLVAERDTNLRKAVLSTMEIVYQFEGDGKHSVLYSPVSLEGKLGGI